MSLREQILEVLQDNTTATNVSDGKGGVFYDFTFGKATDAILSLFSEYALDIIGEDEGRYDAEGYPNTDYGSKNYLRKEQRLKVKEQ